MALFIGRIPMDTRVRELEDVFVKYGRIIRCDVKRGTSEPFFLSYLHTVRYIGYGFVEYEDPRDAEDAIKYCDGMRFLGGRMVVELAKGPNNRRERPASGPSDECFRCGKTGHWARDCPTAGASRGGPRDGGRDDDRFRRDDRSRRDDRYRRDDRDDRDRRVERRRSPSRSRSPARSRSPIR